MYCRLLLFLGAAACRKQHFKHEHALLTVPPLRAGLGFRMLRSSVTYSQ